MWVRTACQTSAVGPPHGGKIAAGVSRTCVDTQTLRRQLRPHHRRTLMYADTSFSSLMSGESSASFANTTASRCSTPDQTPATQARGVRYRHRHTTRVGKAHGPPEARSARPTHLHVAMLVHCTSTSHRPQGQSTDARRGLSKRSSGAGKAHEPSRTASLGHHPRAHKRTHAPHTQHTRGCSANHALSLSIFPAPTPREVMVAACAQRCGADGVEAPLTPTPTPGVALAYW